MASDNFHPTLRLLKGRRSKVSFQHGLIYRPVILFRVAAQVVDGVVSVVMGSCPNGHNLSGTGRWLKAERGR